nr:MAG TPA: Single strand binding protein [Caudoviricetes sp.]
MNSVILIGRLTRDPELVYTPGNQTAVTHFSIAVDRPRTQGREKQAATRTKKDRQYIQQM